MDAGDLRVFEAVARLGGMNRAASELHTVQSNVTARIRQLEEELRTPLFHRHGRGVALTAAGHRLLPYAERVRSLLDDARRAVQDDGRPKGLLHLGSLETTAAMRLSPLLADYARLYPEVDLALTTGTSTELIDAVLARRVEGAFVCGPVDHPELDETTVFREELVLATAPGLPNLDGLAARGDLKIIVLRAGCSYRQRLEAILAGRGVVGLRLIELGTVDGIVGCVAAGLGVTLLPRGIVATPAREGRVAIHELARADGLVETVFVRRKDAFVSRALTAFLDFVRPPAPDRAEAAD